MKTLKVTLDSEKNTIIVETDFTNEKLIAVLIHVLVNTFKQTEHVSREESAQKLSEIIKDAYEQYNELH